MSGFTEKKNCWQKVLKFTEIVCESNSKGFSEHVNMFY